MPVSRPRLSADNEPIYGPNGRPMHHLLEPSGFSSWVSLNRYLLLRRLSQLSILLLFFGTAHWGWTLFGAPLLSGNLSASEFAGFIPMADPYALLQIIATGHWPHDKILWGALIILVLYAFSFNRMFCSWVCPLNMVTDLAAWLRRILGVGQSLRIPRNTRYVVLGVSLLLSAMVGIAAFEWISPISLLYRELIYGIGLGWMAVLGVFILDLYVVKHGWCGHLCPLGAFYTLLGRHTTQGVVQFDRVSCTHCAECISICPEPSALNLKQASQMARVGDACTSCGKCVSLCPENSLRFGWRGKVSQQSVISNSPKSFHSSGEPI